MIAIITGMYACLQKYNDKIKAGQTRLILNSRFGLPLGVQTTSFLVAGFYSLSMAESVGRFAYRYPQEITPTIPSACRPLEPLGGGQNLPRTTHG